MRSFANCCAIVAVAFFAMAGSANAACYTPASVTVTTHVLKTSTSASFLDLCLGTVTVNKKKQSICTECPFNSITVSQNPYKCVAACKIGYIWNAPTKQCCPGILPPPPIIR